MTKRLPTSIDPCPIIDAIVEIRFETDIHPSAVFGIIYNSIKDKYARPEGLPISQLPEAVRLTDPTLKYKPHYKLSDKSFVLQIGANVITISSYPSYVGWGIFFHEIESLLKVLIALNIIKNVERVGLRYIDFFEGNVLDRLEIKMKLNELSIINQPTFLRTELISPPYKSHLQISNDIQHDGKKGTIIDIDTFLTDHKISLEEALNIINEGHAIQKDLFFTLLKREFIETLNPKYE